METTFDINSYLPATNQSWIAAYAESMGWESLTLYYNKLFVRLLKMKRGDKMDIVKDVNPNNYDLFVKCLVTCIQELCSLGVYDFDIEEGVVSKR